jgi:uncharacterized protein YcnI
MRSLSVARLLVISGLLTTTIAEAHPTVQSGPAAANKTQKIMFGLAHGCNGTDDTQKIRIEIPAGISSVRALYSAFGKPRIEKTGANVTAVEWQKSDLDLLATDDGYYELTIRARVADVPFTTIYFNVIQTCKSSTGTITVVPWTEPPGSTTGDPAPALLVVPSRIPGWNKFTLGATTTVAAADVPKYLSDAVIVWRGNSAYSSNANIMAMIASTPGVTALTGDLQPNDEIWVRY